MSDAHGGGVPHPSKSFLTNKIGPLPTWAWMAIGLGIAITISVVRGNSAATSKKLDGSDQSSGTLSGGTTGSSVEEIGGNQRPPVVTQLFNTSIFQPPMGGRTEPPTCAPPPSAPCSGPSCSPLPQDCAPQGRWVSLASSCGPRSDSWESTLGGIARHFGLPSLDAIWNAPENAQLKQRRKDPRYLHAGDRVWVPACAPNGSPVNPANCPPPASPGGGPPRQGPPNRHPSRNRR